MTSHAPTTPPGPFEYRFAPDVGQIRLARHVLANWLEMQAGVDVDAIDDLLVACSELVTNAVIHAERGDVSNPIALRAHADGDSIVLEVDDQGGGFDWPVTHLMSDVLEIEEHGRGLFIVEALTDRLGVIKSDDGKTTTVRCVKFGVLRHVPTSEQPELSARFRSESQRTNH
jgi:anti-sigma regulatory factor (Ser/Thr protein kinase)